MGIALFWISMKKRKWQSLLNPHSQKQWQVETLLLPLMPDMVVKIREKRARKDQDDVAAAEVKMEPQSDQEQVDEPEEKKQRLAEEVEVKLEVEERVNDMIESDGQTVFGKHSQEYYSNVADIMMATQRLELHPATILAVATHPLSPNPRPEPSPEPSP